MRYFSTCLRFKAFLSTLSRDLFYFQIRSNRVLIFIQIFSRHLPPRLVLSSFQRRHRLPLADSTRREVTAERSRGEMRGIVSTFLYCVSLTLGKRLWMGSRHKKNRDRCKVHLCKRIYASDLRRHISQYHSRYRSFYNYGISFAVRTLVSMFTATDYHKREEQFLPRKREAT